jgi:tetratricopeptide (TPR) repeat protein
VYEVLAPEDTAAVRADPPLPPLPIYDLARFGAQAPDSDSFDDRGTAGVIAELEEAVALFAEAQIRMERGQIAHAGALLDRSLELCPSLPGANTYRGIALARTGDFAGALPWCVRETVVSPDLSLAWSNLAWVEANLGLAEEARRDFAVAIDLDPGNDGARAMLAEVEAKLGPGVPRPPPRP